MIEKLDSVIERLESFEENVNMIIGQVLGENSEAIVGEVRNQLLNGQTNELKPITPSYLNDPYFANDTQAQAYLEWKRSLAIAGNKNPETPNLFINGYFHRSLFLEIMDSYCEVISLVPLGDEIIAKYGKQMFGVNDEYFEKNILPIIYDRIINYLRNE